MTEKTVEGGEVILVDGIDQSAVFVRETDWTIKNGSTFIRWGTWAAHMGYVPPVWDEPTGTPNLVTKPQCCQLLDMDGVACEMEATLHVILRGVCDKQLATWICTEHSQLLTGFWEEVPDGA